MKSRNLLCLTLWLTFILVGCEKELAKSGESAKEIKSLHQAAADGDIEQVKLLISKGADVNEEDEEKKTPLHYAAQTGKMEVVQLLVEAGSDVNVDGFENLLATASDYESRKDRANLYYVGPSGNDSHSGTSAQTAWRTVDRVNAVDLDPGDKVLFEGGHDYPGNLVLTAEDAGTPQQPVVIGSYGSGRARIKAGDGSGVEVLNAGGIVVENLIVTSDDKRTNDGSGIRIINVLPNNEKLHYIRVHNVEASGFGKMGIWVGEWTEDGSKSGYQDVRITNCVTCQNKRAGILIMGCYPDDPDNYAHSNVYVGYCKSYDNPGDPEYLESHSGNGILIGDVDGGVIEYCEAYNNGYACPSKSGGPVGIWTWTSNNVVIQYCESHHNRTMVWDGGGFDFDAGTTNSVMQYNYSHDNDGAGYLICSHKNAHTYNNNIVRYNISVNDCRKKTHGAINFWTGSPIEDPIRNTQIFGNTIYSSISSAISFQSKNIYSTKVCNNLFITANNQKLVQGNPDQSMATFAGNAYWAVDGKYDIAGYESLDEWRKGTGQEMLNGKPVGLVVEPKLKDLGKSVTVGDPTKLHTLTAYRLQKDSPLIDAGLDLRSLFGVDPGERDFFGNPIPQGNGYDMGAHEIILKYIGNGYSAKGAGPEVATPIISQMKENISSANAGSGKRFNNAADMVFTGEALGDYFGGYFDAGGDVNGDGYRDLVVSAEEWPSGKKQGRAYLFYGGPDMDDKPDMIFNGESTGDLFGVGVTLGNINGDSFDDVIVGAVGHNSGHGRVYVFYGGPEMDTNPDKIFDGENPNIWFGRRQTVGDLNGDKCPDLIVGAVHWDETRGRVYVFHGSDGADMDTTADKIFDGENRGERFGRELALGKDVNGDGHSDLLVGAEHWYMGNEQGRAYLYFGGPKMDTTPDKIFTGEVSKRKAGGRFGNATEISDIDNDGFADVIIGAPHLNGRRNIAYLYFGGPNMDNVADKIFGFGDSIACGDVNNDGFKDIALGSGMVSEVRVYHGGPGRSIDQIPDKILKGEMPNYYFGNWVKLSDLNGDGQDDLIVGTWVYNSKQGRVYLYYGGPDK